LEDHPYCLKDYKREVTDLSRETIPIVTHYVWKRIDVFERENYWTMTLLEVDNLEKELCDDFLMKLCIVVTNDEKNCMIVMEAFRVIEAFRVEYMNIHSRLQKLRTAAHLHDMNRKYKV
jgi:hypothetical protein